MLLTGSLAYKIKKPLRLAFLDFSTLEQRRRACEDEVRLNRRTAPELYRRVVPISGTPQCPRLDGPGPAIEFAVEMKQFDPQALFSTRLEAGAIDGERVDRLAEEVARFHASLPSAALDRIDATFAGEAAAIESARRNFAEITAPDPGLDRSLRRRLEALGGWLESEARRIAPLLRERERNGFVRDAHGDLHLANVAIIDERPVLFDCLEFDPALRRIDVLDEVAFAFVDFEAHGRRDLAHRFLSRYLETTGDYEGVPCLRFFALHRALVRAKVALLRARQAGSASEARTHAVREAERFFAAAEAQADARSPRLLATCGLAGSGKTTVGGLLVEAVGAIRIRSDVERKRLAGLPADARSASPVGGGLYAERTSAQTYDRLARIARTLIDSGHSVLVDAAFLARRDRERFAALARERSARFAIVSCEAPEATLRTRIAARLAAGRDASEADTAVLDHQLARFERPSRDECAELFVVATDGSEASVRDACLAIAHRLAPHDAA